MKIPLYILGLLKRYGPQHGYRLKQLVGDEVSDFARIKPSAIYYHLQKMEEKGYVRANYEQEGRRPERSVFAITGVGIEEFSAMLDNALGSEYRVEFLCDACLFFADSLDAGHMSTAMRIREKRLNWILQEIEDHRDEVLAGLNGAERVTAGLLFSHHINHYRAELEWASEAISELNKLDEEEGL
jgi:DNA-binding PadR family transcriptional regulator